MGERSSNDKNTCMDIKVPWGIYFLRLFKNIGPKTKKARLNA